MSKDEILEAATLSQDTEAEPTATVDTDSDTTVISEGENNVEMVETNKTEAVKESLIDPDDMPRPINPIPSTTQPSIDINYGVTSMQQDQGQTTTILYNRNPFPVTLDLTDGSQFVLSPNQRSNPIAANLVGTLKPGVIRS